MIPTARVVLKESTGIYCFERFKAGLNESRPTKIFSPLGWKFTAPPYDSPNVD